MGRLHPVLVATSAVLGLISVASGQYYASKYDHIDVDTILNNRRMVNYYAACLLSKGPCPPEGVEFKRILPEALRNNCRRCTEKQKTVALRTIRRLKKEYPKVWTQLEQQWDTDGSYIHKFESTFGAAQSAPAADSSIQIVNRFSDTENDNQTIENTVKQIFSTTATKPTTTSTTTTGSTTTTTAASTTSKTTSTTTTSTTSRTTSTTTKPSTTDANVSTKGPTTKITTHKATVTNFINKQSFNTISSSTKPTKRPRPTIGQSIQATVSFGTNIVGDLVRGLGAIGNRVVETGAEIAGVVLKNIARPL